MDLSTIRERILATPLVMKLPAPMHQRFAQSLLWIAQTKEVSRAQHLIEQGEKHQDQGVLILEGMVRIKTEEGVSKSIEAPDILGEVQLFTPGRARTATVEVVVGGEILVFSWDGLAQECRRIFSEDEMRTLKEAIYSSAWTREKGLFDKIGRK
jgi:hypothetical protein